ncbi:cyclase family protein [bacterium]|nr:cyclase family protein [bacterium]
MSPFSMADFPFQLVDLTHPLTPDSPLWPGDPETKCQPAADPATHGFSLHRWTLSEHAGTHTGAPVHFHPGGQSVDQLALDHLLWPAVVLPARAQELAGGEVTVDWIRAREVEWGHLLPKGAMVVLETGWSERWPDRDRVYERDARGAFTWPGFSDEVAQWLIEEREIGGLGSDAPGIDQGADTRFKVGQTCARAGLPHLENLANLDQLPAVGAWILAAPLLLEKGSGSPSRVVGLLP